jgi:uncharacterized delta-60 repeat protein
MNRGRRRGLTVLVAVLLTAPALLTSPAPATAAAPAGIGPAFDDSGLVRVPLRSSSNDFATALAQTSGSMYVLAAGAGGDFGFGRLSLGVSDVNGSFAQSRTTTDFGGTDDVSRTVAATPSGGLVLAGSAGGDLAVARYDRDTVLDRSFDGDGRVTLDLGSAGDTAYAVVPLADNRVLVAGGTPTAATVVRFLPSGGLDHAFGFGGRVSLPSSGPGRAAALQPDGKLLVAGGGDALVVYRLLADGALDVGFGTGGVASVALGGPAGANAMVLAAEGTITVAGRRGPDVVVARFDALGRADPTFGSMGVTITPVAGGGVGYALARAADGGLLVAGDAGERGMLARYRPDGSAETVFGTNGVFVTRPGVGDQAVRFRAVTAHPHGGWIVAGALGTNAYVSRVWEPMDRLSGHAVDFGSPRQDVMAGTVQPDGKLVALASVMANGFALVRFHQDGTRDGTFGVGGIVASDRISGPQALAVHPDGRLLVSGIDYDDQSVSQAVIAAFRPDGSTDTTFGNDGLAGGDLGGKRLVASSLAVDASGRILMAGAGGDAIARFTAGGNFDPTFGEGGRLTVAASGYPGGGARLTVLRDGSVLALGPGVAVFRLHPDGTLDRSFGGGGKATFERWMLERADDLAVQPDGRILVAGMSHDGDQNFAVVRLLPGGGIDPSWQWSPGTFDVLTHAMTHARATTLTVQPDGKVVVGGEASNDLALMRLNPDGTHDGSFGVGGLMMVKATEARPPVLVVPTETSGMLVVTTDGFLAWPASGVLLVRIATGPLGAPTKVTAVAGSGSARVTWARAPAFDESPALAYRVSASDGVHTATTPDGEHFSAVVRGLTPGRSYTFTVHAVRAAGAGPASAPSSAVTANMSGPTSAWGWNGPSTLGDGTTLDRLRPLTGAGAPGAVALAGGAWHSLSLRADGTVWAWGWNTFGQLGDGTTTIRSTPVQVRGLTNVVAVAAGAFHSLALRADGTVWAWGWNGVGQLGTGSTIDALVPVPVQGLSGVTAISAGFHHGLAVRADGTVAAWGWNVTGQLGDGTTADRWRPQSVPGPTGITAVAGGALHSMAMTGDGGLWTWGSNVVAQLGTHDFVDRRTATKSLSVYNIKSIAAGAFHSFALAENGEVRSWGYNGYGQLGHPEGADPASVMWVWNLRDVATISSGWYHGLAIKHDGSVVTWGWNVLGQLGDGTTRDRWEVAPVAVPPAIAIAGGALHSLAA